MITGTEILKITKFGDLFSKIGLKAEFRVLAKRFHPDISKDDPKIFTHISFLYETAINALEKGLPWESSTYIINGKRYTFGKQATHPFELGTICIDEDSITYIFDPTHKEFFENILNSLKQLIYNDDKMKQEFSRYVPGAITYDSLVFSVPKNKDTLFLPDVFKYFNHKIDPRHVCWMISRLLSITCFLGHIGQVHNGITLNNLLIDPNHHSVLLLGGWWYSVPNGAKLKGCSEEVFNLMSIHTKADKLARRATDIESVKAIGRKLLTAGHPNPLHIKKDSTIPAPISDFLLSGYSGSPKREFEKWGDALTAAFGPRKWVDLTITNLYK